MATGPLGLPSQLLNDSEPESVSDDRVMKNLEAAMKSSQLMIYLLIKMMVLIHCPKKIL